MNFILGWDVPVSPMMPWKKKSLKYLGLDGKYNVSALSRTAYISLTDSCAPYISHQISFGHSHLNSYWAHATSSIKHSQPRVLLQATDPKDTH